MTTDIRPPGQIYGITADELHNDVMLGVAQHLNHFERADLAERFVEMCGTCGLTQALMSVITRLFGEIDGERPLL